MISEPIPEHAPDLVVGESLPLEKTLLISASSRERNGNVLAGDGLRRVVIEGVTPEIDAGRYPIKRVPGESVVVEADVFADGHDLITVVLRYRRMEASQWTETSMESLGNDRWRGQFEVSELGVYCYTIDGWVDHYKTWQSDLRKRIEARQDVSVDLAIGAAFVQEAAQRATGEDAKMLAEWAREFGQGDEPTLEHRTQRALDAGLADLANKYPDRSHATPYVRELHVAVDPVLGRTGAWYEMFPRSCPGKAGTHGTFDDVAKQLPRVAQMGFDIVYLPPIHPIGKSFRKGKNNNPVCLPEEPGSPWAIGGAKGGHKAIHPELGTLENFKRLIDQARELKVEIALDIAFQCSADHPWVREHPAWFRQRPDGTIQYAENPPKKYQDIYPINFETDDWQALWEELKAVIDYWIAQGVRVFRVDNPHTKSFSFWEWVLGLIRSEHPEVIFLAEAFTRPRRMYALAKAGFNQSYSYFTWRNSKTELMEYFTELSKAPVREFFRANLWPNTPDILPKHLQQGGRPAFMARLILAATLGSSYGIYGPAFELLENQPLRAPSEEYLNSEKYEIRDWDLSKPGNLTDLIARVNRIRRENPALHRIDRLEFHYTDNEGIIAYSKTSEDMSNIIVVFVSLDPYNAQSGWTHLSLDKLGISPWSAYRVEDLLTDAAYQWHGPRNYVSLRPWDVPAHVFRLTPC